MEFNIKPFPVTQTAKILRVNVINTTDEDVTVYYELVRQDGRVMETGNQTFPLAYLGVVINRPIVAEQLNQILAAWGLEYEPNPEP